MGVSPSRGHPKIRLWRSLEEPRGLCFHHGEFLLFCNPAANTTANRRAVRSCRPRRSVQPNCRNTMPIWNRFSFDVSCDASAAGHFACQSPPALQTRNNRPAAVCQICPSSSIRPCGGQSGEYHRRESRLCASSALQPSWNIDTQARSVGDLRW